MNIPMAGAVVPEKKPEWFPPLFISERGMQVNTIA